ncbi:hypothetical protein ScalyP_jg6611 [Parmales sp. scaly parma]|nr:hypothetical protein ScalyP_jg6611 [Parmales sp. scaly parma]
MPPQPPPPPPPQNPQLTTQPTSIFALLKLLKYIRSPTNNFDNNSTDKKFVQAIKKIMNINGMIRCLKSLDRRQCEMSSDHVRVRCNKGPSNFLILVDAGVCPVLVENLHLEGLKNTKIVANALFSIRMLCTEIGPATEFSNMERFPLILETLYETENKVYKYTVAGIICRIFSQLGNAGLVSNLMASRNLFMLLIKLLDSLDTKILMEALLAIETLTYHFEYVVIMCGEEVGILVRLVNLLKSNDVDVVEAASRVVNGLVCNGRMDKGVLKFSRSSDVLGQLHHLNESMGFGSEAGRLLNLESIFEMHAALPPNRLRAHGPKVRRAAANS